MFGQGKRPLKVFLCHASGDKPTVRQLYRRLVVEGLDAWLDQEKLLPGQDWRLEIPKAVREADVVIICLSNRSITKEGYIQKEIKFALDIADEKPEGTIFLIPARLEDCPVPERLNRWQWVDLFEENGYVRLLRSLKIRADRTGAVIEPLPYDDKEREKRTEQLYTEGLAAFWVEDWDKACHRFQTILSEQPNHQGAIEKLEEAERQRNFAKLYSKAVDAQNNQEWQLAINTLEELLKKALTYKNAEAMLKTARKEQQLKTLYTEAKTLHIAKKWEAVLRVFEQISSIEPNYADPEGLLPYAQKEVVELERLTKLNELYSKAIHKLDSGEWYEARTLLEQVHKSETGFLETERLLRKVEDEINRHEEQQKRQDQINTLYEQANGLLRSKKWRKALEKIDEIRTLDGQFDDPEKIADQAKKEIEREEQEAERQNELAAMYTEAVRLVREEKYQEALEKLQEVKSLDPKYPDRQMVQWTASRSLKALAKPVSEKRKVALPKSLLIGLGGIVIIGVIVSVSILSRTADPTLYDDFDDISTMLDTSRWNIEGDDPDAKIFIQNRTLTIETNGYGKNQALVATRYQDQIISKPFFIEGRFKLEPNQNGGIGITLTASDDKGFTLCQIWAMGNWQDMHCQSFFDEFEEIEIKSIPRGTWHSARIEVDPATMKFTYYIDGVKVGDYLPERAEELKNTRFSFMLTSGCAGDGCVDKTTRTVTGYFDNIRIGAIADDPNTLLYDNFDNTSFDSSFNSMLWEVVYDKGEIYQEDGNLVFSVDETGQGSHYAGMIAKDYSSNKITQPISFEARMSLDTGDDGGVFMQIESIESVDLVDSRLIYSCGIQSKPDSHVKCSWSERPGVFEEIFHFEYERSNWHTFQFTVEPATNKIYFYMDGELIGSHISEHPDNFSKKLYRLYLQGFVTNSGKSIGLVDYVRIGAISDGPSISTLTPSIEFEFGIDRSDMDYTYLDLSEPNPELCRQACIEDSRCAAFTYVKPGFLSTNTRCYLKDPVPEPSVNECCISGVKVDIE